MSASISVVLRGAEEKTGHISCVLRCTSAKLDRRRRGEAGLDEARARVPLDFLGFLGRDDLAFDRAGRAERRARGLADAFRFLPRPLLFERFVPARFFRFLVVAMR